VAKEGGGRGHCAVRSQEMGGQGGPRTARSWEVEAGRG